MSKIKIGPHEYEVVYTTELPDAKIGRKPDKTPQSDRMGRADIVTGLIHVRSNMAESQKCDTLLHECLHIISAQSGLDLGEKQVLGLATQLLLLIHDNPEMFK